MATGESFTVNSETLMTFPLTPTVEEAVVIPSTGSDISIYGPRIRSRVANSPYTTIPRKKTMSTALIIMLRALYLIFFFTSNQIIYDWTVSGVDI